jgi:hypothetical protein
LGLDSSALPEGVPNPLLSVVCSASAARAHGPHTLAPLMPFVLRPEFLRIRVPATSCLHIDTRERATTHKQASSGGLPWGLLALRRLRSGAATCTGFASPGCAAPSGFLNLLTLSFRPIPVRPCFMPVTPLSFCLQRVPPSDSRDASRRQLPLLPLRDVRRPCRPPIISKDNISKDAGTLTHARATGIRCTRKVRTLRAVLPGDHRSCLS